MNADGKYELAAATLEWTRDRYGAAASFNEVQHMTYRKLMEKYQEFNPFKFIVYPGMSGDKIPQLAPTQAERRPRVAPQAGR